MAASASPHTPAARASKARPPSRSGIAVAAIVARAGIAVCIFGSCVDPAVQSPGPQVPQPAADQPIVLDAGSAAPAAPAASAPAPAPAPAPAAQPAATTTEPVAHRSPDGKTGNVYADRFVALWNDIHNPANGYFSPEGVPYHSVETLLCEAPDYG